MHKEPDVTIQEGDADGGTRSDDADLIVAAAADDGGDVLCVMASPLPSSFSSGASFVARCTTPRQHTYQERCQWQMSATGCQQ